MKLTAGHRGASRLLATVVVAAAFAAQAQFPFSNALISSSQSTNSSSAPTNASSGTSNQSTGSSAESTGAGISTGVDRLTSSWIVAGSAGLVTTAGGIVLTLYGMHAQAQARLRTETLRKSAPLPAPPQERPAEPVPPVLPPPASPQPSSPTPPPLPPLEPTSGSTGAAGPQAALSLDAMVQARAWLLANRLQLQQDLALGAGPAVEDLAGLAGIAPERRAHFGRVVQRLRQRLLVAPDVTPLDASRVMSEVGALVLADPLLRPDAEVLLAAW